jgi:hypothetical protein
LIDLGHNARLAALRQETGHDRGLKEAKRMAERALSYAEGLGNTLLVGLAHRSMSRLREACGDHQDARIHEARWLDWKKANGHLYLLRTQRRIRRLTEKQGAAARDDTRPPGEKEVAGVG